MEYMYHYDSPLGKIIMTGDGEALTKLWFYGQKYSPLQRVDKTSEIMLPIFAQAVEWLDIYFSGNAPDFTPPIKLQTTPFRQEVCDVMLTIPYGHTMTYGEIASIIAAKKRINKISARAVGGAVGHNPLAIIIPCHRVIGSDGSLTGYAGGLDRKTQLLKLEKTALPQLSKSDLV